MTIQIPPRTAVAMAIAYMSVGVFIHAHWFWGLRARCEAVSNLLKLVAVVTFLGSFGNAIYRIVSE